MGRERGNYNLCGCASSMKLRWYIIIQPPGLCGVCYKGTTSTVELLCFISCSYLHVEHSKERVTQLKFPSYQTKFPVFGPRSARGADSLRRL